MKPLPFPFELVAASPALATADALVIGATISALCAYWQSGCQPLPEDDAGLAVVARCHTARWHRVRERVKRAISAILPTLTAVYAQRQKAALGKRAIGRLGGLVSAASVAKRKATVQPTVDKNSISPADTQRAMRPPLESSENEVQKVKPITGTALHLTDPRPTAVPLQPIRLQTSRNAATSRDARRGKPGFRFTG